jgi:hypothetical protein
MMGREQLLPHLLVINLLLLFLQKGERLFVANSMPILLKHLMLRSLVDVCEDPKRLKRECETPTEVATV